MSKSAIKQFLIAAFVPLAGIALSQSYPPLIDKVIPNLPKQAKVHRTQYGGDGHKVLILFDSTTSFGYAGDLYGQQLGNLMSHFKYSPTLEPVENYKSGDLSKYHAAMYLGYIYGNALPPAFLSDVMSYNKPFCWCGFNLWEMAWDNGVYQANDPAFVAKTGIDFMGLDSTGYPTVTYNGFTLQKDQSVPTEGVVQIVNPSLASVVATSVNAAGASIPYITNCGGNFWYVADNPMEGVSLTNLQDRMLAFCDSMYGILNVPAKNRHRAWIRIEDVSAYCPPAQLKAIADVCKAQNVPFDICVIPDYMDPLGVYNNGVPQEIKMTQSPAFLQALQYMVKQGGHVIMHGTTHQYSNVDNCYDAVSADDYEFFRVILDTNGNQEDIGPIAEDTPQWVHTRIMSGINLLKQSGYNVDCWNTPHYMASAIDWDEFANDFAYQLDRGLTFSTDSTGTLHWLQQYSPFAFTDEHGAARMPETIGYISPTGNANTAGAMPADLEARAHANLAVHDGWAGMYFHWMLDPSLLNDLLTRIKSEGYTFVQTSSIIANRAD